MLMPVQRPAPPQVQAAPHHRRPHHLAAQATIHLVMNQHSGSAAALSDWAQAQGERLNGHPLVWHRPAQPSDLPAAVARAVQCAQETGGAVVAVGGDGTINAVAQACWHAGVPMGVVAGGTFNYFARGHGVPESPDDALAAVARALDERRLKPVQVGLVNARVFLVNASLGLYPRLLRDREDATRRWGRHRVVALAAAAFSLFKPLPSRRYRLRWLDDDAAAEHLDASTLFVGNNALQLAQVGLHPEVADGPADANADTDLRARRDAPTAAPTPAASTEHPPGSADAPMTDPIVDGAGARVGDGLLQAVGLAAAHRWAMARLLWRAARGQLDQEPLLRSRRFAALEVDRPGRRRRTVRVAFDGERDDMALPLRFQVGAHPLWLLGA